MISHLGNGQLPLKPPDALRDGEHGGPLAGRAHAAIPVLRVAETLGVLLPGMNIVKKGEGRTEKRLTIFPFILLQTFYTSKYSPCLLL